MTTGTINSHASFRPTAAISTGAAPRGSGFTESSSTGTIAARFQSNPSAPALRPLQSKIASSQSALPNQEASRPTGAMQSSYLSNFMAVAGESKQAAENHQAQGMSIRDGLAQYQADRRGEQFLNLLIQTFAKQQTAQPHSQPRQQTISGQQASASTTGAIIDQIGSQAQQITLNQTRAQILTYIGQQLGVDVSNLSTGQIAERLINAALGETTATTAATAGSAAAGSAAGTASGAAAAGAATTAAGATDGAAAASGTAGTEAAGSVSASSVIGAVGAAYSAYQIIANWGHSTPQAGATEGAAVGGYIGTCIAPGIGTVIGAAIGAIAGGLIGMIHTGKHKDQLARDAVRAKLLQAGYIDDQYNVTLANGQLYNIGLDGGHRYQNLDGTERRAYEIDASDPRSTETIGWLQPIAALITGGDSKLSSDFTGYFVNAALSNDTGDGVNALQNSQVLFAKLGLSPKDAVAALAQLAQQGRISQEQLNAYTNGLVCLLNGTLSDGTPLQAALAQPQQVKAAA